MGYHYTEITGKAANFRLRTESKFKVCHICYPRKLIVRSYLESKPTAAAYFHHLRMPQRRRERPGRERGRRPSDVFVLLLAPREVRISELPRREGSGGATPPSAGERRVLDAASAVDPSRGGGGFGGADGPSGALRELRPGGGSPHYGVAERKG